MVTLERETRAYKPFLVIPEPDPPNRGFSLITFLNRKINEQCRVQS